MYGRRFRVDPMNNVWADLVSMDAAAARLKPSHSAAVPRYVERLAVRSVGRVAIVPVAQIVRLEAADNYVRLFANRIYLLRRTLTRVAGLLDPAVFLRIHRSHVINMRRVRELSPRAHGEFSIALDDGSEITSSRSYRGPIQLRFGLLS
jgi:two-component system LytT family response regulator